MDTAMERHVDAGVLDELYQVMGDEFPSLLETFRRDSEMRIVAIHEAVSARDAEGIRRTAHSFKGSASNMGAPRLTRLCRALEELGRNGHTEGSAELLGEIRNEYQRVMEILGSGSHPGS